MPSKIATRVAATLATKFDVMHYAKVAPPETVAALIDAAGVAVLVEACRQWLDHYDTAVRDPHIGDEPGIAAMRAALAAGGK